MKNISGMGFLIKAVVGVLLIMDSFLHNKGLYQEKRRIDAFGMKMTSILITNRFRRR